MLRPVLSALSYLHKRCLTHGHLRPTNIMVIDDQVGKLSPDFGWCSRPRNIYDPPEAGTGNPAPAADIWSLGVLLVEALTQRFPVWDRSKGGEPEIPTTIPEPFFTICRECLRTDPERRCTVARVNAHLDPPQAVESPVQPAQAIVDHSAKPSYSFRATILSVAFLVVLLMFAAFKFGCNLTPSSAATAPQPRGSRSMPQHRRQLLQPLPRHLQLQLRSRRRHQHQLRQLLPHHSQHQLWSRCRHQHQRRHRRRHPSPPRETSSRDRLRTRRCPTYR